MPWNWYKVLWHFKVFHPALLSKAGRPYPHLWKPMLTRNHPRCGFPIMGNILNHSLESQTVLISSDSDPWNSVSFIVSQYSFGSWDRDEELLPASCFLHCFLVMLSSFCSSIMSNSFSAGCLCICCSPYLLFSDSDDFLSFNQQSFKSRLKMALPSQTRPDQARRSL